MFIEELKQLLKENLRIDISSGDFYPNSRVVKIYFDDELITEDYFDVVQKDEYRG